MSFRYDLYYSLIGKLIETDNLKLLRLMKIWIQYNNPNLSNAIEYILDRNTELNDEFFDKLIELLDQYNKTELALKCVRCIIEREKKERFAL